MSLILIVEDEPKLAALIQRYFMAAGYETHWLSEGLEVIPWIRQHGADLILLDVTLPGRNGLDIAVSCERSVTCLSCSRRAKKSVPLPSSSTRVICANLLVHAISWRSSRQS
jgi:CheY-like chemotaxis protein